MIPFENKQTILFIGDSITDGGRTREDPHHLGLTYAGIAAGMVQNLHPELRLRFLNRGIGGDKVSDLRARWQEDVIDLKPDWLSVSIGINDVWSSKGDPVPKFAENYRWILDATRDALPACKLILCETTVIGQDFSNEENTRLEGYNAVINELAGEFDAVTVPMREAFRNAIDARPDYQWTNDGVHTSCEGSVTMALCWLGAMGMTLLEKQL